MSDTPETLAAVLAEMRASRNAASDMTLVPPEWLTQWADRIEAAAKREREINQKILAAANEANAILKDDRDRAIQFANAAPHPGSVSWKEMHEALEKAERRIAELERTPGNAAALREALERFVVLFDRGWDVTPDEAYSCANKASAALAAPARNCDVGTAEEQAHRFHAFCSDNTSEIEGMCNSTCPCIDCGDKCHCLCVWSQMPFAPAEGGAKCIDGLRGEPDCRGCEEHCLDVRKRNCFYWNPDIGKCALDGRPSCRIACDNFHVSKEEKPVPAEGGAE